MGTYVQPRTIFSRCSKFFLFPSAMSTLSPEGNEGGNDRLDALWTFSAWIGLLLLATAAVAIETRHNKRFPIAPPSTVTFLVPAHSACPRTRVRLPRVSLPPVTRVLRTSPSRRTRAFVSRPIRRARVLCFLPRSSTSPFPFPRVRTSSTTFDPRCRIGRGFAAHVRHGDPRPTTVDARLKSSEGKGRERTREGKGRGFQTRRCGAGAGTRENTLRGTSRSSFGEGVRSRRMRLDMACTAEEGRSSTSGEPTAQPGTVPFDPSLSLPFERKEVPFPSG